jgi:hypothetical protein
MALRPPTHADIRDLGAQLHLNLTEEEVADFRELVADSLDVYESVRDCGQPENPYTPGRDLDAGHRVRDGDPSTPGSPGVRSVQPGPGHWRQSAERAWATTGRDGTTCPGSRLSGSSGEHGAVTSRRR